MAVGLNGYWNVEEARRLDWLRVVKPYLPSIWTVEWVQIEWSMLVRRWDVDTLRLGFAIGLLSDGYWLGLGWALLYWALAYITERDIVTLTCPYYRVTMNNSGAAVEVTKDRNGTDQVLLRNSRGASARMLDSSCHLPSRSNCNLFRLACMEDRFFHGGPTEAILKPPYAVRGGIPICFPQFGQRGSLEQHGFARNRTWIIDENPPPLHPNDNNGKAYIDLLLKPNDLKIWPHRNINSKPFSFSIAYHTYFSVSDISEVRIEGLETLDYLDNLCQRERFTEQGDALTFESEVKRPPLNVSKFGTLEVLWLIEFILAQEMSQRYLTTKENRPLLYGKKAFQMLLSVWNLWEKKSKAIADFGDEEYKQMLCVNGGSS
ncbi:Detected protein of confused Function [Hibiscus syriacus]|uniref:Detected protein of confused Function n=1 Tax=Hibiscus syriacus TaxID=106335 RepID=A0A6A2YWG1_HIBSY|nr:Detected protein of confused Function [Hibiscus syriacus]